MSQTACSVITETKVKVNENIKPPSKYSVIYFNDNVTSAIFVAQSLIDIFGFSVENAAMLTEKIDKEGSGLAANGLTKELATHLKDTVIIKARAENFPLKVEIKEESEN